VYRALISADLTGAASEEDAFDFIRAAIQKEVDEAGARRSFSGWFFPVHRLTPPRAYLNQDDAKALRAVCEDTTRYP